MRNLTICAFLLRACSSAHEVAIGAHSEDPGKVISAASLRAEEVEIRSADCEGGDTADSAQLPSGSLRSLELVRIRSFDPSRPASGWRMVVDSERGPGTIVRFDRPAGECYVGAEAFHGWPESTLRRAYDRFSPTTQAVESFQQLD